MQLKRLLGIDMGCTVLRFQAGAAPEAECLLQRYAMHFSVASVSPAGVSFVSIQGSDHSSEMRWAHLALLTISVCSLDWVGAIFSIYYGSALCVQPKV